MKSDNISYPPFTHRRRFYYDQSVAENVADRGKSQEKRSGVYISASRVFMIGKLYALATFILNMLKTSVAGSWPTRIGVKS